MRFTKMQGAGNDYVYVDCFADTMPPDPRAWPAKSPTGTSASAAMD